MESSDPGQPFVMVDEASVLARKAEKQWLMRARAGDTEAFAQLVQAYRAPVYAYLGRCGIDDRDRDDLFQDIFLKIYRAAASYDAERPLHPWIFTIVGNTVRTHLRKQRLRQLVFGKGAPAISKAEEPPDPPDPSPGGERRALARQRVRLLESELQNLSSVQRQVVHLACVEKLSMSEVAEALALPVNTVKTHLRRARLALAKGLARCEQTGQDQAASVCETEARS